mmetsp:Transcript_53856/g.99541  ORF Transcript_53856/g.99541 Transcript_53856/m.99541 type:complete len:212 (+) Transcript_53856:151-786(+)
MVQHIVPRSAPGRACLRNLLAGTPGPCALQLLHAVSSSFQLRMEFGILFPHCLQVLDLLLVVCVATKMHILCLQGLHSFAEADDHALSLCEFRFVGPLRVGLHLRELLLRFLLGIQEGLVLRAQLKELYSQGFAAPLRLPQGLNLSPQGMKLQLAPLWRLPCTPRRLLSWGIALPSGRWLRTFIEHAVHVIVPMLLPMHGQTSDKLCHAFL